MTSTVQVNTIIDKRLKMPFKIRLLQDQISFRSWLEERIREYLDEPESEPVGDDR
jgi:hypothetical protein